jgi:hypothetical protein
MENRLKYFAELREPRVERTRRHLLQEILLIAIASNLSGASGWDEIDRYGYAKKSWLKSFLASLHDIPSHDTHSGLHRLARRNREGDLRHTLDTSSR